MNASRALGGAVVLLASAWMLSQVSELVGLGRYINDPPRGALGWLVAAFLGGLFARSHFIPVAVGVWAVVWGVILFTLYRIAEPTGQASVPALLQFNAAALALSLGASILGSALGQLASRRGTQDPVTA